MTKNLLFTSAMLLLIACTNNTKNKEVVVVDPAQTLTLEFASKNPETTKNKEGIQVDENGKKIFFFINDSTYVTDAFESNFLIDDSIRVRNVYGACSYYDELCGDRKVESGISLYKTGEKEVKVTCGEVKDGDGSYWEVDKVTFYYKNGNKRSENFFGGCDHCAGNYITWWNNGNLRSDEGKSKYWHKNGQIKYEFGISMDGGRCKAASYYESGQIKKLAICDDIYSDGKWKCFDVLWGNMDYCLEECFDKEGKKRECK